MSESSPTPLEFELVRSRRTTADIVLERDGRLVVRVPETLDDDTIAAIVESKRYWIYRNWLNGANLTQLGSCESL